MIAIVDYGINNLDSVKNALDKLGSTSVVTNDATTIQKSDALILPGVGTASEGMKNLKKLGLDKLLTSEVHNGKPFLGICLGMQLMMDNSAEGNVDCLGLIKGNVRKFSNQLKVPQIGWNQVRFTNSNLSMFTGIPNNSNFYFVHSYVCRPNNADIIVGETTYGQNYCSILKKKNIYGVQFHPEKSGGVGFQLLKNIINSFYI